MIGWELHLEISFFFLAFFFYYWPCYGHVGDSLPVLSVRWQAFICSFGPLD
jgi:hypothetical protein